MKPSDQQPKNQPREGRKKLRLSLPLFLICSFLVGIAGGFFLGTVAARALDTGDDLPVVLLLFLLMLLLCILSTYLQILVHEGGHLLFGLLTGYRFRSFRVGSLMWVKEKGRIRLRRFKLAGTGGQCLMTPPPERNGRFPFLLYNLGGSLLNLIFAAGFASLTVLTWDGVFWVAVFLYSALLSLVFAMLNGIPLHLSSISNDGYHALVLSRDEDERRAFYLQMQIHDAVADGNRLRDLPDEWFPVQSEIALLSPMQAALEVFRCNRLMDGAQLETAEAAIRALLDNKNTAVSGVHRTLLLSDLLYLLLLKKETRYQNNVLLTKEEEHFLKMMKDFPSVIRTGYAYLLLRKKDEKAAKKLRLHFERVAGSYPYPADIAGERNFLSLADKIYAAESSPE